MKRLGVVCAGSDSTAQQVAEEHLLAGGDAVGAVAAGFFAAAGEHPGVLFGPLSLLLARVGVGARAFDGRQRQPGHGARRVRGFDAGDVIPAAARVAAPSSIAALLVALRYGRNVPLHKIVAPGIALAERAGAGRRAEVLDQIQRLGASALAAPGIARSLLHVAGPSEGGSLGKADLEAIPAVDHPAAVAAALRVPPWHDARTQAPHQDDEAWSEQAHRQQGLCAADAGGGLAVLCYDRASTGLGVEELELTLPFCAVPARRGVTRIQPGTFLRAPTPIAIEVAPDEVPLRAIAALGGRAELSVPASGSR